jgi:hypothetical protein
MPILPCLKWPEMRTVALDLIDRMRKGHLNKNFSIPLVDFTRVFAPNASEAQLAEVSNRDSILFKAEDESTGSFTLPEGERALLDLGREGLVMRVPVLMSGTYLLQAEGFRIIFNEGEELEGCKKILLLVCNRVLSVDVTTSRVDIKLSNKILNLCVEFE